MNILRILGCPSWCMVWLILIGGSIIMMVLYERGRHDKLQLDTPGNFDFAIVHVVVCLAVGYFLLTHPPTAGTIIVATLAWIVLLVVLLPLVAIRSAYIDRRRRRNETGRWSR